MKTRELFLGFSLAIAAALIGLALPGTARAATTSWIGGDGDWSVDGNWSDGVPGESDEAFLQSYGNIVNPGGLFQGEGVVTASFDLQGGTLAPGSSPGLLTINGNFNQTDSGILAIELGGYDQGTDYDSLWIDGPATLAGTLNVSLWDLFTPEAGKFFDIFYAKKGINGIFESYLLPEGWNWDVAYLNLNELEGLDTVRLTANAVPIPDAIWLLGSGLIGLVGIRRRINK